MAANIGKSPVMGESFSHQEIKEKDLRSLSAAIMAATERAELVAHETDRWLSGHQEFDTLDIVHSLVGEAEGRLVQIRQMTVIQELDKFMDEITVNAPIAQAKQLNTLVASTKETFSSAIDSLERFVQRSENIDRAYNKYKESEHTLGQVLTDTSTTLEQISHHSDLADVVDQVEAVKSSRSMLSRMKTCLRNMKDAMAGIESLTLTVCDLGMEDYMKKYKQRRTELSDALTRLEAVQSEMERFVALYGKCESTIAELNGALREPPSDSKEMEHLREQADQVQQDILDMERLVESMENQNIRGPQRNQLSTIKESYAKLVTTLSAAYSTSYQSSLSSSPRGKSPHRSPRHRHLSDTSTPRQTLRQWLRSKTDELQELMSQPFPFDDKRIQTMWHSIQKYQGDLVVKGEEFSLYASESDGDTPAMDQITPLIDTCADLSYRLDTHARLCVQYTADQNGLLSELKSLEEAKGSLQHSDIPLREQHRMCADLLDQVNSLKRRVHDQLINKLPAITVNLAKKEGGSIVTDTSELDASVSKQKLELKAFYQSLEASISNLDLLIYQLTDLHSASSQLDQSPNNFTFTEPISRENVVDALNSCKRQLAALSERQQYIDKLLSEKGTAIGQLPVPDDEQFEQTLAESTIIADRARRKLEQHHSNLTSLQETVERFDTRCDEAKDSLKSAESLLDQALGPSKQGVEMRETIETVTTQCKTRLHECVTYIEQAEIAVTEMEQSNDGVGKMDPHKDTIKEIQAKHKALSARLREVEKKVVLVADNQRSLDSLSHKFDDWLKSAEETIGNNIGLDSGLNDMRDHIIKLHELEKSVDGTNGWLVEMKKLCRSLSQSLTIEGQEEKTQMVSSREQQFEQLKGTLTDRIDVLSKEMEVVIAWIQKSSELVGKLNQIKYQLTELSNKETDVESIHWKLDILKGYLNATETLQGEFGALLESTPAAVSERQLNSCSNGQASCEILLADLTTMFNNLSHVEKVWTEFGHLAAEVKDHHRHCESQLEAVNLPGVSLDARQQRYQEILEALEHYPEGTPPTYLQQLLSTCPVASPGLYSEAIGLMDEHEKLLSIAKKGAAEFSHQLQARSDLELQVKSVTVTLKEMVDSLECSVLLDDWSIDSCDSVLRLIKTQETELKVLSERVTPQILEQKEQHAASEETMTLDLKECIDDYDDIQRELTAQLLQEKEVLVLTREYCQYLTESRLAVGDWISRTAQLSNEVNRGTAPADTVEQRLEAALGELPNVRQHLDRMSGYSEQISGSLNKSAGRRLSDLVKNLANDINSSENGLKELLEHHGQLGKTKAQQHDQLLEVEEVIQTLAKQVNAANSSRARSKEDCEEKLQKIEALEIQGPEVQSHVENLYQTTNLLTNLLRLPKEQSNEYEQGVKQLCVDRWGAVKAKLLQAKKEATNSLEQFKDLESQYKVIEEGACEKLQADIEELEAVELHTLPVEELNLLAQKAGQCSASVSELWQKSLAAQEKESTILSKLGSDAKKSGRGVELNAQLTRLAARCQAIDRDIEQTSMESQQTCASLERCLEEMRGVEQVINQTDDIDNVQQQQEQLQQAKNEVSKLYQVSNEVMSSLKSSPPPDVACIMNSIHNLNESLLEDVQLKLGQAERVMDQWNVVHVMQQELETWMSNARQTMSAEIVDSQVALDQQKEMEEHVVKYKNKLEEFTMKSHDLERTVGSLESQRLLETATHFQNNLSGIKQGLDKRREQVSELVKEEENFQKDLQEMSDVVSNMNSLTRQEITDVTPEKCEQLANQYQEKLRDMPAIEKKLNDLVALSIRLGDSSHHADSTTKVLDLKKEWSGMKAQLSQQANVLKETTRLLLSAPQQPVSYKEWTANQEKVKSENEDSLRDLHLKVDGTELMQTEQVMSQLRLYETEDSKLKALSAKITDLVTRKEQLQEASLDPLMLKDWAAQMMNIDFELKQLYMKCDETAKRQVNVIDKAHQLADEGMKREQVMEELIMPQLSNALDLSIDSEHYVEETPKSAVTPHKPTLSQDEHAAKLFTVERNPETVQAEEKMNKMISEQENLQTTLADVNRKISQWQWTLDQDYHTTVEMTDTLNAIQRTKSELDKLCKSESSAQEPSLSVLSMSLETLELRCLSELQRAEANDNLSQDHKETLESIEEEVVTCQKYLDYLGTMPGGAEEKLPGVEHRVSKLQRMFQTLKLINPRLCEGSLVSEYLGQLMNDLQVLQGRLEVIPEEDDFHAHGKELHSWQEHMAEHVSSHETNSDTEFVDRVVRDLNSSLGLLSNRSYRDNCSKYIGDSLNTYKEMLCAAGQGLRSGRLVDSELAASRRDNLQTLFTLFESYRLHMGSLSLSHDGEELEATLSALSKETQRVQGEMWCEGETCSRLKDKTVSLCTHCDSVSQSLSRLQSNFLSEQINVVRLERSLALAEPEYQGLVLAVKEHLTDNARSSKLKEKAHSLQQLWGTLQECVDNSKEVEKSGLAELSTQLTALQQDSQRKLDLSAPLNICLNHALDMLVELDTLNWVYKELNGDETDVDLEIKAGILSIKPKMNAIRADMKAKLRECFNSPAEEICNVYSWLGEVKPFTRQLSNVSAIDDYLQLLLAYQCTLGQRSYITGLMMSLVTSCDHDVIISSQHTVKVLHEAKMTASKQHNSAHSLRSSYRAYESTKSSLETWIAEVQSLCKECPIGSQQAVNWLLQKTQKLHSAGLKLTSERDEFTKRTEALSSEALCSQSALKEMSKRVKDLLNKQESSMRQLSSLIEKLKSIDKDWVEFTKVFAESCEVLDKKEYLLDTVPTLAPHETLQGYLSHLTSLKTMLTDGSRQVDRIQTIAHRLRLTLTVASTVQELDSEVKYIKNREFKIYSQRIPLMVERWIKAQNSMTKYENCIKTITDTIREVEKKLMASSRENAGMTVKEMEQYVHDHQRLLHKLDSIEWSEVERHSSGVGQLTGIVLCEVSYVKKRVNELRVAVLGLLTEATESCAALSHNSQSIHSLETKLNRIERDPLLTNSQTSLQYKTLLERRSKTEQLLYTLLNERQTLDSLESHVSCSTAQQSKQLVESFSPLEGRYTRILELISSKLLKLQEEIIVHAENNELQSAYQDWKNQVIQITSMQFVGDVKDLEEQRLKCLLFINLSPTEKLSLSTISKSTFSSSDHEHLLDLLHTRESHLVSLILKHKLFNRLKGAVTYSLNQIDSNLHLPDHSYESHATLTTKVPMLKAIFEQHQRSSLVMRQICQELLPHCNSNLRSCLLSAVQKSSTRWQSVLSRFITQSDDSMTVMANAKRFNHSLYSLAKEIGGVRHGCCGSLPEHHDHLQERQSYADVYQWRLEKLTSKSSVLKFDISTLESQANSLTDLDLCFSLSQTLMSDSEAMLCDLKHELSERLSVWSSYVSEVNVLLHQLQQLEKLYMNERRLTIEELLEEITTKYSLQLKSMQRKSEAMISLGTSLLSTTGDLYGSAIQHGIVSLQNSMKHLFRLSTTRTSKLRDTMSAILEFEHGMKSLNQWFKSTESSLSFTPPDWQDSTLLYSNQYLLQLEKDISHHSRTVTAVINLCSLLQYDRDAGYDQVVKRELAAVKERLGSRWKRLCEKIIVRKEHLYELGQAWSQMKIQTDTLIADLLRYKEKCDEYSRSKIVRPQTHQLSEFTHMLRDCEHRHEDMRLLNNRHRYLIRQNMLDSSDCIRKAVGKCTELWDSVYQTLSTLVKEMKTSHEAWTDFVKERDVLLAKISNLSLILKTRPGSRSDVEKKLTKYQSEVKQLFEAPVSNLRRLCTIEQNRKLDDMIRELTVNLDTLTGELRPLDDLHVVEEELDLFVQQTEDIEHDLESLMTSDPPTTDRPNVEMLSNQQTAVASGKVADIERRVDEIAQRASLRRKITPSITTRGSNESLDSLIEQSAASLRHQPRMLSPGSDRSISGEANQRLTPIGSPNLRRGLIGSQRLSSASCNAINNSAKSVLPSSFRVRWLKQPKAASPGGGKSFSRPSQSASSTPMAPFQQYLSARRRSLSRDRTEFQESNRSTPQRTRSVSLERGATPSERLSRGRTQSARPSTTSDMVNIDSRHSPTTRSTPSPIPTFSTDSVCTEYLISASPMTSPFSRKSPVSKASSYGEEQTVNEGKQLRQDVRHTLEWIDKIEVLYISVWNSSPVPSSLSKLMKSCRQYNDLLSQYHYFNNLVTSINLLSNLEPESATERERLNRRWQQGAQYLPSRQLQVESAVVTCTELKKQLDAYSDAVTHSELKLLSGTHSKQSVAAEVRQTLVCVRSYITLLTSLLCESEGTGSHLLSMLRTCEVKCQNILS